MSPATASHVAAAPLRVFITNDGAHSAAHWAKVSAHMLVSTGQNISPGRLDAATALKTRIEAILTEAFGQIGAASTDTSLDVTAGAAVRFIQEAAQGSPWEMEFGHEAIAAMMKDVIRRNLATHADILLRTE